MRFSNKYWAAAIGPICIELLLFGILYNIRNDNDSELFEFMGQLSVINTVMIMFGLSLAW